MTEHYATSDHYNVPGLLTGLPCGPTEQFGEPFSTGGCTFQTWWCACGNGVNAQVSPENLLTSACRQHLRASTPNGEKRS